MAAGIRNLAWEALGLQSADKHAEELDRADSALAHNLVGALHVHAGGAAWDESPPGVDDESPSALESYHFGAALGAFSVSARIAPYCTVAHDEALNAEQRFAEAQMELLRVGSMTTNHADPAVNHVVYDALGASSAKERKNAAVRKARCALLEETKAILNNEVVPGEAAKMLGGDDQVRELTVVDGRRLLRRSVALLSHAAERECRRAPRIEEPTVPAVPPDKSVPGADCDARTQLHIVVKQIVTVAGISVQSARVETLQEHCDGIDKPAANNISDEVHFLKSLRSWTFSVDGLTHSQDSEHHEIFNLTWVQNMFESFLSPPSVGIQAEPLVELRRRKCREGAEILENIKKKLKTLPEDKLSTELESLPAMVAGVYSKDNNMQLEATTQLRKLLSIERSPPVEEVIKSGVVPRFVQFLTREEFPQLQFEAVWALTNIASGTSENTKVVIDHGAIPIFVKLLQSGSDDVREQAVWALGNDAGDSPSCRDLVLANSALMPLLGQLNKHAKLSMLRNVTWTLSNLCRRNPQPAFEQTKPALPALARLIHSNNEEVLTDACWALSYLSAGTNEKIQSVTDAGVCPRLVELLLHPSPSVLIPALRTVGNIVTGDDSQTQCIIDHQALSCLLSLLTQNHKKSIKKEACWTVSNITADNKDQIQPSGANETLKAAETCEESEVYVPNSNSGTMEDKSSSDPQAESHETMMDVPARITEVVFNKNTAHRRTMSVRRMLPKLLLLLILLFTRGCLEVAAQNDGAKCDAHELSIRLTTYCDMDEDYQSKVCCDSVFATLGRLSCLCKVVREPEFRSSAMAGSNTIVNMYYDCNGGPPISATMEEDCDKADAPHPPPPTPAPPPPPPQGAQGDMRPGLSFWNKAGYWMAGGIALMLVLVLGIAGLICYRRRSWGASGRGYRLGGGRQTWWTMGQDYVNHAVNSFNTWVTVQTQRLSQIMQDGVEGVRSMLQPRIQETPPAPTEGHNVVINSVNVLVFQAGGRVAKSHQFDMSPAAVNLELAAVNLGKSVETISKDKEDDQHPEVTIRQEDEHFVIINEDDDDEEEEEEPVTPLMRTKQELRGPDRC